MKEKYSSRFRIQGFQCVRISSQWWVEVESTRDEVLLLGADAQNLICHRLKQVQQGNQLIPTY